VTMSSQILLLCYQQVQGNLNEKLTADQMSLGAFFHTPLLMKRCCQ